MRKIFKPLKIDVRDSLRRFLNLPEFSLGPVLMSFAACVLTAAVVAANINGEDAKAADMNEFETGKVADRDVVARRHASYTDEEATALRLETQQRLVPAVFRFSGEVDMDVMEAWNGFCDYADSLTRGGASRAVTAVQNRYPSFFSAETLAAYFNAKERNDFRRLGAGVLDTLLKQGVFAINRQELANYNPDMAELQRSPDSGHETILYADMVWGGRIRKALAVIIDGLEAPLGFSALAADLLAPFVRENAFFSSEESLARAAQARGQTAPVVRNIDKGKRIIRKGFIVTEEQMRELRALYSSIPSRDPRNTAGTLMIVLTVYMLFIFLRSRTVLGRELSNSESYLLSALAGSYFIGAVLIRGISFSQEAFPVSLSFPTALLVMIFAVFMGTRLALVMAIALPLGAYLMGAFDFSACVFALVSGVAASMVLKNAEKRMDIIKAGFIIAGANCAAVLMILLVRLAGPGFYPFYFSWAVLNGIVSGMLLLGMLPLLEQVLNAVTPFRLMELADLNAPILRRLFTVAPGTYSHSIMVANLAEQACQDIGANALLARVGAYYHDIGKMENPEYFVENQTDYNKHDDINPRLSATVIRSHVKVGIEKARSLGLPKDIIAFIAEHHGDSLIKWFYNKAVEQGEPVSEKDFVYPGNPPRSRESAVVMLADITEAAARTLDKPTAAKLEKFIQGLFDAKADHGQLSESDLTFRDIAIIKKSFVRVLAGYYHSRIEYPGQKKDDAENDDRKEEAS